MKLLIITVAGCSTRFSAQLPQPELKCLYPANRPEESMLYRLLGQAEGIDRVILVGGYRFGQLREVLREQPPSCCGVIELVENTRYREYGSMESLYVGLCTARAYQPHEILFAEGDLMVDRKSFVQLCETHGDVVTFSPDPIDAQKSVVAYLGLDHRLRYLYDQNHQSIQFPQPVRAIWSSGQMWNFGDAGALYSYVDQLRDSQRRGTNLELVGQYFSRGPVQALSLITFARWKNCNTPADYWEAVSWRE